MTVVTLGLGCERRVGRGDREADPRSALCASERIVGRAEDRFFGAALVQFERMASLPRGYCFTMLMSVARSSGAIRSERAAAGDGVRWVGRPLEGARTPRPYTLWACLDCAESTSG